MKKNIVIVFGVIIILGVSAFLIFNRSKNQQPKKTLEQNVMEETYTLSKEYVSLRYQTDKLLIDAESYADYDIWNQEMLNVIESWESLEKDSLVLEKSANEMAEEKMSFNFISSVFAYDKQEISNVFDKASAGKKIATLAKFLGVDAKRAFKILQQDQNQVTADGWNEAGDTLQNLETSATVIKDGCKIAGFVGGIVISGGTSAIAAGSTLAKATVIITGADLTLEVSEDAATIALGNHNKISAIIGDARKITEPITTLLNINEIPKNLKTGFEKFNAAMIAVDQFKGAVQDGKIIGVALPVYTKDKTKPPVNISVLKKEEVDIWLNDNGIKPETEDQKTVEEILSITQPGEMTAPVTEPSNEVTASPDIAAVSSEDVNSLSAGTWAGTLQNTSGGDERVNYYELSMDLNTDGTVTFILGSEDFQFLTWKQFGTAVRLYGETPSGGYYEFNHQGNSLVLIKTVIFSSEYLAGEEGIMGGKEIEGTLTKK